MFGPGKKTFYTRSEKVANFFANIGVGIFGCLAFVIRKIRRPYWDRKEK